MRADLFVHEINAFEWWQVDMQFRKRWKSLLSVDDAIAGVATTLDELGLWDT
eukprot:COSAG05_NODE_22252_length_266_cov_0.610778_2_plen_51_part_01